MIYESLTPHRIYDQGFPSFRSASSKKFPFKYCPYEIFHKMHDAIK